MYVLFLMLQKHFEVVGCKTRMDASAYRPRHLPELVDNSSYSAVKEDICQQSLFEESIIEYTNTSVSSNTTVSDQQHVIRE